MQFSMKSGEALSEKAIDNYLTFLKKGGAVKYFKTAKDGLQTALVVVELNQDFHLVGMGAIKARRPEYNEKISTRSGFDLPPYMREIGYIVVDKNYQDRGFSKEIVRRLLDFDDYVFATTSSVPMMHTFRRLGFHSEGYPWLSKEGNNLVLWVKGL